MLRVRCNLHDSLVPVNVRYFPLNKELRTRYKLLASGRHRHDNAAYLLLNEPKHDSVIASP